MTCRIDEVRAIACIGSMETRIVFYQAPLTGCEADASALAEIISRNADHSANFQTSLLLSSHGPVLKAHVAEAAECIFSIHADAALFYFA